MAALGLIVSSSCPSELSSFSALTASDEGQLAVATSDGVLILVSCKIVVTVAGVSDGEFVFVIVV